MELTRAQELVKRLKEIKANNEITYPRILDMIESNGKSVSLSTLRRVFADGSDANSFSYENTLLPIADVLLPLEDNPDLITDSPHSKEIDALKAVIRCQNEELAQLYETKTFLQDRIKFMAEQIMLKDKRMDAKDEIIAEKEAMIKRLLDKLL